MYSICGYQIPSRNWSSRFHTDGMVGKQRHSRTGLDLDSGYFYNREDETFGKREDDADGLAVS